MQLTYTLQSSPDLMVRAEMYKVWEAFIFAVEREVSHINRLGEYGFMEVTVKYVDSVHYLLHEWGYPLFVNLVAEKRSLTKSLNSIGVGGKIHRLRRVDGGNVLQASTWNGSRVWAGTTDVVVPELVRACVNQLRLYAERELTRVA